MHTLSLPKINNCAQYSYLTCVEKWRLLGRKTDTLRKCQYNTPWSWGAYHLVYTHLGDLPKKYASFSLFLCFSDYPAGIMASFNWKFIYPCFFKQTQTPFSRVRTNFWTDKHLHGCAFRLHGTRGTVQVFKWQTLLQSVTRFAQFRVKLHR